MKSCVVGITSVSAGMIAAQCQAAFTFNDIELWAGDGDNSAALVIDWNGGPEPMSIAWGYRWDGEATGADMLMAVIAADSNLFARFASFGFGDVTVGLGYDLDGDGFSINDGTGFDTDGIAFAGTSDGVTADDPDDHYAEGWDTGFWSYWLGEGEPFDTGGWSSSIIGMGDRALSDGAWDGLRFAPGFISESPREPVAAVPTPGVSGVLAICLLASRRRR